MTTRRFLSQLFAHFVVLSLTSGSALAGPQAQSGNQPPTASDDSYFTPQDTTLNVAAPGVLANYSNPENDPMFASRVAGARHGALTLRSDGSFTYTPNAGFVGQDTFTYQATEGRPYGSSNIAIVTLNVGNDEPLPPVARDSIDWTLVDTPLEVPPPGLLDNDDDPNGEPLTASLVAGPSHGSLTLNADGSFSYTPEPGFVGTDVLQYRATDPTGLSSIADAFLGVNPPTRFSLHSLTTVPANPVENDPYPVTLGVRFRSSQNGSVGAIRFYQGNPPGGGDYYVQMWNEDTHKLVLSRKLMWPSRGWATVSFPESPIFIQAGTTYVVAYFTSIGLYAADQDAFPPEGIDRGPLHFLGSDEGGNGVYVYGPMGEMPTEVYNASDYYVDMSFTTAENQAPVANDDAYTVGKDNLLAQGIPGVLANDTDVDYNPFKAALVSDPVYGSLSLEDNGSFSYTPPTGFVGSDTFTYKVRDYSNAESNVATVTLNVVDSPATWPGSALPSVPATNDPNPVELGVKFRTDVPGKITAIRFYRGAASGYYVMHLWDSNGNMLHEQAIYEGQGPTPGWQGVGLFPPVQIQANTTYIASYFAPGGNSAIDQNFFAAQGVDGSAVLHYLQDGVAGGNGVYRYGGGAGYGPGFPTDSWNASNYWVAVEFEESAPGYWPGSAFPSVPAANDPNPVLLGVKFRSDVATTVTGIRFYRGADTPARPRAPANYYEVALYTDAGQYGFVAAGIVSSGPGWKQIDFSVPIAIEANTTYIAAYHASGGNYAIDQNFFASQGVDGSPTLHYLQDGVDGGNGVYRYCAYVDVPRDTWHSSNYWIAVVVEGD